MTRSRRWIDGPGALIVYEKIADLKDAPAAKKIRHDPVKQLVILAGGKGTRLKDRLGDLPKTDDPHRGQAAASNTRWNWPASTASMKS